MMPAIFDIFTGIAVGQPEGDPACLAEALRLLKLGMWPVPIYPPDSTHLAAGKAPIGRAWGATRPTEESLREVWSRHPGASVGLKLGREAGVIDVEVDDPETGEESLAALLGGECVETLGWSSARGSHNLFAWDERLLAFGKSIYKPRDFPGVEIRLGHGEKQLQSVCPPSPVTREVGGRVVAGEPREWIEFPIAPIPAALIRALESAKAEPQPAPEPPRADPFAGTTSNHSSGNRPDAEQRALFYLEKCNPAVSGEGGHNQAFKSACKVGPGFNLSPEATFQLLWRHWNHKCKPPWSEKELQHKVADAYANEPRRGWLLSEDRNAGKAQGGAGAAGQGGGPAPEAAPADPERRSRLVMVKASSIKPTPVRWLVHGRIPLGMMTLLAGEGAAGKSSLTISLTASVTRGEPPFGCDRMGSVKGPADVLILGNEDGASSVYIPRLLMAGADMDRVNFLKGVDIASDVNGKPVPFAFQHAEVLMEELKANSDIKLVIIDPIATLAGRSGVNDNRNAELASHLEPFIAIADERQIAILLVTHLNKGTTSKAIHRVIGSVAYANSCRVTYAVGIDPDDEDRRILSPIKFNSTRKPGSIAYRICQPPAEDRMRVLSGPEFSEFNDEDMELMFDQISWVAWEGETDLTADDCLDSAAAQKPRATPAKPVAPTMTGHDQIKAWAVDVVTKAGGAIPSEAIVAQAKALGVSYDLLHAAVPKGDRDIRRGPVGHHGPWHWILNPKPPGYQPERDVIPEPETPF